VGAGTWISVALGWDHTCGVRTGGVAYCWGKEDNGRAGIGPTPNLNLASPTAVLGSPTGTAWTSVSASAFNSCGIRDNGTLWCWGYDASGELGDDVAISGKSVPTLVFGGATNWRSVVGGERFNCGTRTDNTLWCWGDNGSGRLGSGTIGTNQPVPGQVPGTTWRTVSAGEFHACAIKTTGTLWCWGDNAFGQLGQNTTTDSVTPLQVGLLTTWSSVGAGLGYTCATHTDKTVWCWGDNGGGQLGVGFPTDQKLPIQVPSLSATSVFTNNHSSQTVALY
jgi:alpha-tubulin suppressor-like RCC1 family protein